MKETGIGCWGLGMIGKTHLEALRLMQVMFPDLPPVKAQVLCTRSVEDYKKELFEKVTSDPQEMLRDPLVTMIDIPTPNYAHFDQTKAAIEQGKNVYLEKPIAVNLREAAALREMAEKAGIVNRAALIYRFIPAIAAMHDAIQAGKIGQVIHFRMCFYHHSYLNPNRPISWRQQSSFSGGGSMMDLGIHFTDLIHWFFGQTKQVSAVSKTVYPERFADQTCREKVPNDTEEYCSALLTMENGVCGTLESSRVSAHTDSGTSIEVYGTEGSLCFDVGKPEILTFFNRKEDRIELLHQFEKMGAYSAYLAGIIPPPRHDAGFFLNAHLASLHSMILADAGLDANPCAPTFAEAFEAQKIVSMIMTAASENRIVTAEAF